jgi:Kdo2-lipid IVA lauroyltransferase/acyltransferase
MAIRLKHRLEYGALRTLGLLCNALPYRLALALGAAVAALAFYGFRWRVAEAQRRIRLVLGDAALAARDPRGNADRATRRIAWISLRNLCFNTIELLRFPQLTADWIDRHVDTAAYHQLDAQWDRSTGAILAVPHLGNWDLAGVGAHLKGLPIFFLARRQKNPLVDDYLNRMRGVTGVETVLTDSHALRAVIRNLKDGKIFAMLPDVRARQPGVRIDFLGAPADLATGMDAFARRANAPIFPAYALREGWTRHRWVGLPPIAADHTLDRETDQKRIMQTVMTQFDQAIRQHPENYFWYNKRWILDPLTPT